MHHRPPPIVAPPVALTIAGSDSGGGAGVQADLLTFAALGVFGTTAITCLTAQNPASVTGVHVVPADFVSEQARQVADFFPLRAVKTGMLFNREIIHAVAAFVSARPRLPVVIDPVMVATSGAVLLRPEAIATMTEELLPLATLVTPNLDEARVLLGRRIDTATEMSEAANELVRRFGVPVLLKGGHLAGAFVVDVLAQPGKRPRTYRSPRIKEVNTHGSGCTLSAAIAAGLAHGKPLEAAVRTGRSCLHRGLRRPLRVAKQRFIAHG